MKERFVALLGPLLGAALLALALGILHRELAQVHLGDVLEHLNAIPGRRAALALALTVLGYLALTGYDWLAFRYIQNDLAYGRIALSSFLAYVFSHNVGLSFFGGSAVRYRILTGFGVKPAEIARVIAFNLLTFWLGFLALGGAVLAVDPISMPAALRGLLDSSRPVGAALLLALVAYVSWSALRSAPIRVRGFEIALPRPGLTAAQILLSSGDWALAAGVLYALLPPAPGLSFAAFLGIYLLAVVAGLVSHVPAGLGVFETAVVLLLSPYLSGDAVLGSVVAYRIVYYLVPLAAAVVLFTGYEALQRQRALARARDLAGRWLGEVVPRLLAAATLAAGGILLLSGATPAAPDRMARLARLLPLPALELSHFLGSVIGAALLLLARALQQRIDAAYFLTLALLGAGSLASLLKGFDYEEAAILAAMLVAFLPSRRYFYRRSSLLSPSFSASWVTGLAVALAGTAFVVALAHRHVEYSSELWWQFELSGHAPRSLRALVGACAVLLFYSLARLLRPVPPLVELPNPADLERAAAVVAAAPRTTAHLALLGDKRLLFHEDGSAFVMYGVAGRSWIAMGDPVGPAEQRRELAWRFRELADRHGGRAVFYETSAVDLPVYLDLGLSLYKLGEEARVPLAAFSLEGGARKGLRQSVNRMQREGCAFELVPPEAVAPLLDPLEAISDSWLSAKKTREKRFSLGFFDREYLKRGPLALVRREGRIVAFANVWLGAEREELSLDLMRHGPDAPSGAMDYLFAELMLWGRSQGFRWFSLGMAPLSGFEHHRLAPLWNRLGAFLFRHGEHFYNFQGLRSFKDKFDPVWEPCYLASPGGRAVPLVLTQVAALIAAGFTGVVTR